MENHPIPHKYKSIQDDKFLNALAEAFRLQEAIINSTHLAIISTTPEGVINSFNKAAEELLGYSGDELIGKSNPLIFHDLVQVVNVAEALSEEMGINVEPVFDVFTMKVLQKNQPYRSEWIMIRKDGSRFPSLISISALRDEEAVLIGHVMVIENLFEQKSSIDRAATAEQKFRLLAENVPGVIYLCHNDENYSMIYLNDRVKDLTGYDAEEFIQGRINFVSLYHPDDKDEIFEKVNKALTNKTSFQLKYRIWHRSGDWRWLEEVGVGLYSDDKLLMIEGFISDITVQELAEQKLEKVAAENLRVFNNPVHLNVIAGFDGYFKRLSPLWSQLLGWSEDELRSRKFIDFVHPEDVVATFKAASFVAEGNNLFTFENRYRCKNGSYRWLLWSSASDVKNQLIYASAVDISERKKYEEELLHSKKNVELVAVKLQEQNRQLDEFAHIISHNLRSPIGNIQALINLLDESSSLVDYKMIFDKLKNVSKNLGDTMNDLMDTLKVRTNTNIERSEIRFKDVLDKIVQSLEGDLIMAEASVTFDFNTAPLILYPKSYLESIFQNLLTNAIKYKSDDRKPLIHFQSKQVNQTIELRVSDNGLGIDLEQYGDKLFGLHKTFHMHEHARGVGLFLIKNQVDSLGGQISVESTVDKGTTFIITF